MHHASLNENFLWSDQHKVVGLNPGEVVTGTTRDSIRVWYVVVLCIVALRDHVVTQTTFGKNGTEA